MIKQYTKYSNQIYTLIFFAKFVATVFIICYIHSGYSFIIHESIRSTFGILAVLTDTCARILTIFFCMCDNFYIHINMFHYSAFDLKYILCCWICICNPVTCFSLTFICYHIKYCNIYAICLFFGNHIFGDKTLQLLLHLPKLIMNGWYLN